MLDLDLNGKTKLKQEVHIWKLLYPDIIFDQLISEPLHILSHSSSYIDLIFTNQPNFVVNCGTQSNSNTKNVISRLDIASLTSTLNIPLHRTSWCGTTKKRILKVLFNNKTIYQTIFYETIINIFSNFVLKKVYI